MINFFLKITLFYCFIYSLSAQDVLDDNDFGRPGFVKEEIDDKCDLSDNKKLLELLDFKLKKFNPKPNDDNAAQMTPQEIKQASIRFYNQQLVEVEAVKMRVETFATLGGDTL